MINSIISSIGDYISSNEEEIRWISQDKNKDKEMIISAQKIVKDFIISRKLIIFGGLAIDYALRLKGSSIYFDKELPDYDCLSYRNVDDAYDLGEILYRAGFENVKVIRAKHIETMRVRVDFITVADIGYVPKKFFDQYKFLMYDGMRIIHPDIQRLDLHRAFCFPFNNPPMEDIFHRWEKDLYRFNLYSKYYPIEEKNINNNIKQYEYDLPKIDYAFHGFAAFALFRKELLKYVDIDNIPKLELEFINKKRIKLEMPINILHLVTNDSIKEQYGDKYYTILNIIPESIQFKNVCIYYENMLSIVNINNMKVVNIQYLLMWLLFNYNFNDNLTDRNIYGKYYLYTLKMIDIASDTLKNKKNNPFNPSLIFLGDDIQYKLPSVDPNLPINYTPSKLGSRQEFNYNNFHISGEKYSIN